MRLKIANRVKAYLSNHPDTGAVLALGPMTAVPTIAALKDNGKAGENLLCHI
jgi:simple sugar transport system substrate-binding protein